MVYYGGVIFHHLSFPNINYYFIPDWMTNAAYSNLGILTGASNVFNNVQDDITSNQDLWHSWLQSDEPEKHTLPGIPPGA
jgi:hypothetical protein